MMDDANFENYKMGLQFTFYGGHYNKTPIIIKPGVYGRRAISASS